jgi:hypothetical protein
VAFDSAATVGRWLADQEPRERAEPLTYIVDVASVLWLAPRRSEHVACARGGEVLAAGEMQLETIEGEWWAVEISNQSTGYCPDTGTWHVVRRALNEVGVRHPVGSPTIIFRLRADSTGVTDASGPARGGAGPD